MTEQRPMGEARMWIRRLAVALLISCWSVSAGARGLDFSLWDDTAQIIGYTSPPPGTTGDIDNVDVGGGLFINDDGDSMIQGIVHVLGPPAEGFSPLQLGAGAKAMLFYLDEPGRTAGGLALGASARISFPAQVPQALVLRGHAAPNITSFGRANRVFEGVARYKFEFTEQASAYVGFRYLRVNLSSHSNQTLDNNLHVGVRLSF